MANELKAKVIFKHKLEVDWNISSYVPSVGEMIIYDAEVDKNGATLVDNEGNPRLPEGRTTPFTYARAKYGNGKDVPINLSFATIMNIQDSKDESVRVPSAKALGNNSIAFGANSIAGAKAWYIKHIDQKTAINNGTTEIEGRIYLQIEDHGETTIPTMDTEALLSEDVITSTNYIELDLGYDDSAVGCDIAIKNYNYFVFRGARVSAILGNCISYTGDLGFSVINETYTSQNFSLWLPAHPISNGPLLLGSSAVAEGLDTKVSHGFAHAEGWNTLAAAKYAHTEGNSTKAGGAAHAEGQSTIAAGENSHAEGYNTYTTGDGSHAEGRDTQALNKQAHVEGYKSIASGESSHAEGNSTTATDKAAHAEGSGTKATGPASHAEGYGSQATGPRSHAEGNATIASGDESHAEGYKSKATANYAHAEGTVYNNKSSEASGVGAHAEGGGTLASGQYSHAEGRGTEATGVAAHSEGVATQALNSGAHVEGYGTVAGSPYQHVQGKYNIRDDSGKYVHIVGWGTGFADDQRKNIHTLDNAGNAWFKGDLYVRGNDQDSAAKVATVGNKETDTSDTLTIYGAKAYTDKKLEDFEKAYITEDGNAIDKLNEIAGWIVDDESGAAKIISDTNEANQNASDALAIANEAKSAAILAQNSATEQANSAAESARDASTYKDVALGAQSDAELAEKAAKEAQGLAEEAKGLAEQAANNANASKDSASAFAADAESAKNEALTAQRAADEARTYAEAAKDSAESTKAETERLAGIADNAAISANSSAEAAAASEANAKTSEINAATSAGAAEEAKNLAVSSNNGALAQIGELSQEISLKIADENDRPYKMIIVDTLPESPLDGMIYIVKGW